MSFWRLKKRFRIFLSESELQKIFSPLPMAFARFSESATQKFPPAKTITSCACGRLCFLSLFLRPSHKLWLHSLVEEADGKEILKCGRKSYFDCTHARTFKSDTRAKCHFFPSLFAFAEDEKSACERPRKRVIFMPPHTYKNCIHKGQK